MPPLNGLARTVEILDGQLEVSFLPYHTIKSRLFMEDLKRDEPYEDWVPGKLGYWAIKSCLLEIKALADSLDYRAQSLLYWWEHCADNATEGFILYQSVVELTASDALTIAYNDTRADLPKAPEILHAGKPDEDADPEILRAGKRHSRKSSR